MKTADIITKRLVENVVPVGQANFPMALTVAFRINGAADREKLIGILGMYGYKTWATVRERTISDTKSTYDYYVNVEVPAKKEL
ncbi:MAG: hypothetical protein IJI83_03625 [Oscillospiraceae bacterium]|nr:hypothetical protein [Oscillospiraceae bacterium]